jgi:hypothetical protein
MHSINRNKGQLRVAEVWDGWAGSLEHKNVKKYTREVSKQYGNEVADETSDFLRDFGRGSR